MMVCGEYGEDISCLYGPFEEQKELELRREAERDRRLSFKKLSHGLIAGGVTFPQVDFSVLCLGFFSFLLFVTDEVVCYNEGF